MDENKKKKNIKIFETAIIFVANFLYFLLLVFSINRTNGENIYYITKMLSLMTLFLSIVVFEIAYYKDSGTIAINGIEILALAIYTLTMWNITKGKNIEAITYLKYSCLIFSIYYFLKVLIMYTIQKKQYLDSLSDIEEIVKIEPIKKEAKRKNK